MTASQVWPQSPAPEPFGQYIVYSAAGVYDASAPPLEVYEPSAWGPGGADELLAVDGRHWVRSCLHDD